MTTSFFLNKTAIKSLEAKISFIGMIIIKDPCLGEKKILK